MKRSAYAVRVNGFGERAVIARLGVLISLFAVLGCVRAARMAHAAPRSNLEDSDVERERPTADEVVSLLDSSLSLSEEQKAQIRPIIAARQEEMKALAADTSDGQLRRARRARAILEDSDRRIEALLSEEQREKYSRMREQMRAQAKERVQQRRASGGSAQWDGPVNRR